MTGKMDFKGDHRFWEACAVTPEPPPQGAAEISADFRPIATLYAKYLIISEILERGRNLKFEDLVKYDADMDNISVNLPDIIEELPIYEAVYAIMINDIGRFIHVIEQSEIDMNYELDRTAIFRKPYVKSVRNFTFLTIAASIGRYGLVRYLIDHGADTSKLIIVSGPWHTPLSVNECLIMSTLFRWFKSGMKDKIGDKEMNELVDLIIYVSQKDPSIVSDESIHPDESPLRRNIYWSDLVLIAENKDFVERLIPLNPMAMRALYDL